MFSLIYVLRVMYCWRLCALGDSLKLNIITVIIGNNPVYGYQGVAPIYDVAFETMKIRYPRVFLNVSKFLVYVPGSYSCPDAAAMMPLVASTKVWDLISKTGDTDFNVIFSSGCSLEIIALGDYAREWNVPLLSSLGSDSVLADKVRYGTVSTYAVPDHGTISITANLLLEKFQWRIIIFLCDGVSRYPVVNAYYALSCTNVRRKLDLSIGRYTVTIITFDSKFLDNYEAVLLLVLNQTRVIFIFAHPMILRSFMLAAYTLNMTNGEYVFLSSQVPRVPGSGRLSWRYDDDNDQATFEAYQSLIILTNPNPAWEQISGLLNSYSKTSRLLYNYTYVGDEIYNDMAISAFEAFATFGSVINESWIKLKHDPGGQSFTQQLSNRTYIFPSRQFYLNSKGMRVNDVQLFRLNTTSGLLEETWHYYAKDERFVALSGLSTFWKGGNGPPLDRPVCGFRNEVCVTTISSTVVIGASLVTVFMLITVCALGTACLRQLQNKGKDILWWSQDETLLSDSVKQIELLRGAKFGYSDVPRSSPLMFNLQTFNNALVWVASLKLGVAVNELQSHKKIGKLFATIRDLHHENVGTFIGIVIREEETSLIYQFGSRGSLRLLLSNRNFTFHVEMQSSISWEIISGVQYIQQSNLRVHGFLSSLTIMLDERFCIRICDYATYHVLHAILKRNVLKQPCAALLWRAPELQSNTNALLTKEADVYSVGIILAEVFTRESPLDVDVEAEESLTSCINQLQTKSEPRMDLSDFKFPILPEVLQCLSHLPSNRPTLRQLINSISGKLKRHNIMNSLVTRLQRYSKDMESLVHERTMQLLQERNKVDELLCQIMPEEIVRNLRNQEKIEPEAFDSVTIMFSDFPDFAAVCSKGTPFDAIMLLNYVYTTFDGIVALFDVYKVETINDSYMVASGLPIRNGNKHVGQIASLSLAMMSANHQMQFPTEIVKYLPLRIGFHSGRCAAGIIGILNPRYCLFGDTVNTASRMESHGFACKIHISTESNRIISELGGFITESRGEIVVKGKGLMETFWLTGNIS